MKLRRAELPRRRRNLNRNNGAKPHDTAYPAAEEKHRHTDDAENPRDEREQIRGRVTEKQAPHVIEPRTESHEQNQRAVKKHEQHQRRVDDC